MRGVGGSRVAGVRGGFTLVEMLVALAVLVVAMVVVSTVFGVATRTAQQSTALSDLTAKLRAWEIEVREDLRGIDPQRSILVLVGRTQRASRADDDLRSGRFLRFQIGDPNLAPSGYDPNKDSGDAWAASNGVYSDPRADIMMFITQRSLSSQAPPSGGSGGAISPDDPYYPYLSGAKFSPALIVYGHASIATAKETTSGPPPAHTFSDIGGPPPVHIEDTAPETAPRSRLPALRWTLGRRATILAPRVFSGWTGPTLSDLVPWGSGAEASDLDDFGRMMRGYTGPGNLEPGDVAGLGPPKNGLAVDEFLRQFGPSPTLMGVSGGAPGGLATFSPYDFDTPGGGMAWPASAQTLVRRMLYPGGVAAKHHVATIVENPPPALRSNLALQSLPGCAWFQVEFLMPEDPRSAVDYYDPSPNNNRRTDMPRWTPIDPGSTYVFVPDTLENRRVVAEQVNLAAAPPAALGRLRDFGLTNPGVVVSKADDVVNHRRVRMWPYAIRITVRAYDARNRLGEPLERSVVHRFR